MKNVRGYALATTVICVLVLFGFLGLTIDLGYFFYVRRQMQKAADAAATGAAHAILLGQSDQLVQAGRNDAALNGFTDGINGVTVTIHNPPGTGPYTADVTAVEALISEPMPTMFAKVIGVASVMISTRAVARLGSGAGCIYALDPSANNTIVVSGAAVVNSKCGVIDDSSSNQAFVVSGSACLTANWILVTGNDSIDACVSPQPLTYQPPVPDPLAYVPAPAVPSGCDHINLTVTGTATLSQGVYCGGITIQPPDNITFLSGTYFLVGGGLNISGSNTTVQGTGVTFYNTANSTYAFKPIVISGGGLVTLSAPTSGSLAGILFFQDRSIYSTNQNTISGGSTGSFTGALYFRNSPLVYSGGSGTNTPYSIVVADTITISGNSYFDDDYSQLADGSPIKGVVLAE